MVGGPPCIYNIFSTLDVATSPSVSLPCARYRSRVAGDTPEKRPYTGHLGGGQRAGRTQLKAMGCRVSC